MKGRHMRAMLLVLHRLVLHGESHYDIDALYHKGLQN